MTSITADQAKAELYELIDQTAISHSPIVITSKKNNAVLISEEDWRSIEETIFLNSIPEMADSIIDCMNAPDDEFDDELE